MIKHSNLGAGGVLLAAVIGLAACGGGSAPAPAGGAAATGGGGPVAQAGQAAIDPCSLVTRAEAETAMAEPATGAGVARHEECKYTAQANDSDTVTVTVGTPTVLKTVVTGNGVGGTVTTEPVSGLGDEAIYQPGLQTIYVRKGDQAFLIQLATIASIQSGDGGATARALDVTLARAALGRL